MRCSSALLFLATLTSVVAGCAAQPPAAAGGSTGPSAGTTEPDDVLARISAALETAGVEDVHPDEEHVWRPDLAGSWRDGTVLAWAVDPDAVDQVAEVRGSVSLQGTEKTATAVVHGPELVLVRVACDDVVVDVTAGVDDETGSSDEDLAVELARAVYPALGC